MKLIPILLIFLGGCTIYQPDNFYYQEIQKCYQTVYEAQSARMIAEAELAQLKSERSQAWLDGYMEMMSRSSYSILQFIKEIEKNEP